MRVIFYATPDDGVSKQRAAAVINSFVAGVRRHGDECELLPAKEYKAAKFGQGPDADVVCAYGLQAHSRKMVHEYRRRGTRVLLLDKGLIRSHNRSAYNRVCIDGGTPNAYLMRVQRNCERWEALRIELQPRRAVTADMPIVYANNSQKVHDYWDLGPAQAYTKNIITEIKRLATKVPVMYRPKRTLVDICKMKGVALSLYPDTIETTLENARVLVTYGSNCAINAIMAGIPAICLGPCAANPVSGNSLEQLRDPPFPSEADRYRWLCNVAWCQWSAGEMKAGIAWDFVKEELRATEGKTRGLVL